VPATTQVDDRTKCCLPMELYRKNMTYYRCRLLSRCVVLAEGKDGELFGRQMPRDCGLRAQLLTTGRPGVVRGFEGAEATSRSG